MPAPAAAVPSSSTCRATSRRPRSTSATRRPSTCPAGARRARCIHCRSATPARRSPMPRSRCSTSAAARSTATPATSCVDLAEAGGLPVITTLMGKGAFPETHPLFFGWPGMHGPKWANLAMNTCDVLVAIGARFDDRVTGKLAAFAPGATVIHLDIDPAEISKLRDADVPVVGPLKKALPELAGRGAARTARRDRRLRRPGSTRSRSGATSSRSGTRRAAPSSSRRS